MGKKPHFIIITVFAFVFLTAFSLGAVRLRDVKLLIDLDRAISVNKLTPAKDTETENITEEGLFSQETHKSSSFLVNVRHTGITCEGKTYYSADEVVSYIISRCKDGDEVILADDYAEAHVYRDCLFKLKELCDDKGLEFTTR